MSLPSLQELRRALLAPRAVAVLGASTDPSKPTGRPVHFLRQHGFKGDIWPINPRRSSVQGLPAFPDLRALPGVPDQVYIVLDSEPAMTALEECVALGVPIVSLLAGGFSEIGPEGLKRESKLLALAHGSTSRILGPNCLGVVCTANGLILSANAAFAAPSIPPGRISVISQSGSAIGALVSRGRARGIGFANLISVGNEVDLSVGVVGQALVDDPRTEMFVLFLELLKHAGDLEAFADAARQAGKNVLVYKLGRSAIGARLALSHTGAIISADEAVDAYIRDLGFHRIDVFETVFEGASLFANRYAPAHANKPRVSIVTTTGGGGALVADGLGLHGIDVASPSEAARRQIAATGVEIGPGPLIDLTLAGTKPDVMRAAIEAVLDDPECDASVAVIGSSAEHSPELAVKPIIDVVAKRQGALKPLVVFLVPEAVRALTLLADAGVAAFRTPEACVDALVARLRRQVPHLWRDREFSQSASLRSAIDRLPPRPSEIDAIALFEGLGIPIPPLRHVAIGDRDRLGTLLEGLAFPLVAKVVSADLPHKSDHGGVRMNFASIEAVRVAIEEIGAEVSKTAPRAVIKGFLVQEQRAGVQEALLGLRRDPAVGPIVSIGVGGLFAELYADVSLRRAPVSSAEAAQMIAEVRGFAIARGYRGRPKGDLPALAAAIAAFSQLGAYGSIAEAEANPVIIGAEGKGVWAVDGLIAMAEPARSQHA